MAGLKTALTGYATYKGREGHINFVLHRITGLGTGLFLTIHILDTALVYFNPTLYTEAIKLYQNTLFGIGEILLVFCVFFHGVNGLRVAYFDMLAPKNWAIPSERVSSYWTWGITLVLWIPAALVMLHSLLFYNYGLFGG
jgi:succinate dehydrogenase / fumarate reductase, cytochrome b subunit